MSVFKMGDNAFPHITMGVTTYTDPERKIEVDFYTEIPKRAVRHGFDFYPERDNNLPGTLLVELKKFEDKIRRGGESDPRKTSINPDKTRAAIRTFMATNETWGLLLTGTLDEILES